MFVTGQDEVKQLMKKLKITFPSQNNEDQIIDEDAILDKAIKASKKLPKVDLNSYSTKPGEENDEMLEENDVTGNSRAKPVIYWAKPEIYCYNRVD